MYCVGHSFPRSYLVGIEDARGIGQARGTRGNIGSFCNDHGARYRGALRIVLYRQIAMDVGAVCAVTG